METETSVVLQTSMHRGSSFLGPVIADFNGDSKLDIAVSTTVTPDQVDGRDYMSSLGNGLGGFGSTISTSFDASETTGVGGEI